MSSTQAGLLAAATAEIEAHVGAAGWDRRPTLFALVRSAQLAADARLGMDGAVGDSLTSIEQEELPEGPLDEVLAQIGWPAAVVGCALSQEILILPPSAECDLPDESGDVAAVANHPDRREARLVVGVVRAGEAAALLRLRGQDGADDGELLTGADLAPNLVDALLATLEDD